MKIDSKTKKIIIIVIVVIAVAVAVFFGMKMLKGGRGGMPEGQGGPNMGGQPPSGTMPTNGTAPTGTPPTGQENQVPLTGTNESVTE